MPFLPLRSPLAQVHPRIRGEYPVTVQYTNEFEGSPPHPRGILIQIARVLLELGFTPASAGNIVQSTSLAFTVEVHPRIRGEYLFLDLVSLV